MPSFVTPVHEFNPNHEPAGSPKGGQFARATGGTGATSKKPVRPHQPDEQAQADATLYNKQRGLPPVKHGYVDVDQQRAGRIADAYDAMPVDDRGNPAVARAYAALGAEIQLQWDFCRAQGMTFTPWTKEGQPYQTSAEMAEDVASNRHLYFYQGGEVHPLLNAPGEDGLSLNDKFRAVHDYFGHAAGGYGFGPRGEENAWLSHSQMFSPDARRAMTTETRGQNSWVNFGRHNYDAAGNYKNIPPEKRPYAIQKVALLPEEFIEVGRKFTESRPAPRPQAPPTVVQRKPAQLDEAEELRYRRPPAKRNPSVKRSR